MPRKYERPRFLPPSATQEAYERWLRRKAQAHVRRDRRRGNTLAIGERYRRVIHQAVIASAGQDAYTGEVLDWTLISQYDNERSKKGRRRYKKSFALLPTVDHEGDGRGAARFKICGWRTNDAKHDLSIPEFLSLCRSVLRHHGYAVSGRR